MLVQLTEHQARVIGVLLEKEKTTPDQYPLTLNSLTTGCNQKSNREPVMQLSESEVQNILDELRDKNLLFEVSGGGSRVMKYKHRFCNTEFNSLKFTEQQVAIICVLLLRGPQTPGELRTRTNRLAEFVNVTEVEQVLESLFEHNGEEIVLKLEREPGKRESRYAHLFSGKPDISQIAATSVNPQSTAKHSDDLNEKVTTLELEVRALRQEIDDIKKALDL